jgi:hypothetical protein
MLLHSLMCSQTLFCVFWNSSIDFKSILYSHTQFKSIHYSYTQFKSIRYSHTQFKYVYMSQERNPSRFATTVTAQICSTVSCTLSFPDVELVTVELVGPLFPAFLLSNRKPQSTRIASNSQKLHNFQIPYLHH